MLKQWDTPTAYSVVFGHELVRSYSSMLRVTQWPCEREGEKRRVCVRRGMRQAWCEGRERRGTVGGSGVRKHQLAPPKQHETYVRLGLSAAVGGARSTLQEAATAKGALVVALCEKGEVSEQAGLTKRPTLRAAKNGGYKTPRWARSDNVPSLVKSARYSSVGLYSGAAGVSA